MAQERKSVHSFEAGGQVGDKAYLAYFSWEQNWGIAWNKRIKLGYGARFNHGFVQDRVFRNAFQSSNDGMKIDTLQVGSGTLHALNLSLQGEVSPFRWLDIGFNLDLVGLSFGHKITARYQSYTYDPAQSFQVAKPEIFNVFLFGRSDRGTLNSQFYLRCWPVSWIGIKAGFSVVHFYYQTDQTLNFENNRFFSDPYMGFLAVTIAPWRNWQ